MQVRLSSRFWVWHIIGSAYSLVGSTDQSYFLSGSGYPLTSLNPKHYPCYVGPMQLQIFLLVRLGTKTNYNPNHTALQVCALMNINLPTI